MSWIWCFLQKPVSLPSLFLFLPLCLSYSGCFARRLAMCMVCSHPQFHRICALSLCVLLSRSHLTRSACSHPSLDPLAASNAIEEVSRRSLFSKVVRRVLGSFIQNPTWSHDFQSMMQRDHLSFANYYSYISGTYTDEVSRSLQTQCLPHRLLKLGLMVIGLSPLAPCHKIIWTYKYSASGGDTRSSFELTL